MNTGNSTVPWGWAASVHSVPRYLAEGAIPGFDSISWVGLLAPAGTLREITDKISADIHQALALDEVKARLAELGARPVGSAPDTFAKLMVSDRKRYAQIIADKNIHAD